MKKDIIKVIINLICVIILVFVSIPIWEKMEIRPELIAQASNPNNDLQIYALNNKINGINASSDVYIYNKGIKEKGAALVFAYDKSSVIDYKVLSLKINNEVVKLSDIYFDENDKEILFLIEEVFIEKYGSKKYEFELMDYNNEFNDIIDYCYFIYYA